MDTGTVISALTARLAQLESELASIKQRVEITSRGIKLHGNVTIVSEVGKPVFMVSSQDGMSLVSVLDEQENNVLILGATNEGKANGFQLRDQNGNIVAQLQTFQEGGVMFTLSGNNDASMVSLAIFEEGGFLTVKDAKGNIVFQHPTLR